MRDALIHVGWRGTVLAMIFLATLLGLASAASACMQLLGGAWSSSATLLVLASTALLSVKWLCDHRDELIES